VVTKGARLRSAVVTKKNKRKLRYFVAVVGFVLVALELMLAFNAVALYQSLICSVYLLFNILIDVSAWIDEYWVRKYGRKVSYPEGRLIGGVILIPFWLLFNWLLGLIQPKVSQEIIWLCSLAIVMVLTIMAPVPDYIIRERSFSKKKRSAVRRAIGVLLTIVIPYITIIVILSAFGVLSRHSQSLAVLAFLPIMFFAMTLSSMIASRSQLKDALAGGTFFASVTAIPFAVAVFMALPISYQIPYVCFLIVAYMSFIYWLRSVRAKNRQKRERRTSQSMNQ
jgi:hypothetical protein